MPVLLLHHIQYIPQLVYQLMFFPYLEFSQSKYSPTWHDLSHSYYQLLGFQINLSRIHLCQSILCIHICVYFHFNVVYYYKHLHLFYIYIYHFHAILCVFGIRLNTLTFKPLTISETKNFANGSLILLQLPLHSLGLISKGENTGSSLLTLTIFGLTRLLYYSLKQILLSLHLIYYNQRTSLSKSIFAFQTQNFIILCHSFSLKNCECLIYHQQQYHYNQH